MQPCITISCKTHIADVMIETRERNELDPAQSRTASSGQKVAKMLHNARGRVATMYTLRVPFAT